MDLHQIAGMCTPPNPNPQQARLCRDSETLPSDTMTEPSHDMAYGQGLGCPGSNWAVLSQTLPRSSVTFSQSVHGPNAPPFG